MDITISFKLESLSCNPDEKDNGAIMKSKMNSGDFKDCFNISNKFKRLSTFITIFVINQIRF